jgi:hypothetical protein
MSITPPDQLLLRLPELLPRLPPPRLLPPRLLFRAMSFLLKVISLSNRLND